jgi:GMP synthase (glutamine-hydrolysing)
MQTATILRHVAFEDLGVLSPLIEASGYIVRNLEAGVDDLRDVPIAGDDLMIVLGGPIGAYEEDRYPFLVDEMRLIDSALRNGARILGVCLGAQLLARVLGARVYPGPAKEIGYAPITLSAAGERSCLRRLADCDYTVLHWHGDTFDLPAGTSHLASTTLTPNQAFALGTQALALQFHIETDPRAIERWLIGHTCELSLAGIDIRALRQASRTLGASLARAGETVMRDWLLQSSRP